MKQKPKNKKPLARGKKTAKRRTRATNAESFRPFEEIARRKGVKLFIKEFEDKIDSNNIHLDMDMVEESLRSALRETAQSKQTEIHERLQRLLQRGTDVQKVDFVLGSGTYYFPEDIDHVVRLSRASSGKPLELNCQRICETVWYTICRCTGNAQWCRDETREVCRIVCG